MKMIPSASPSSALGCLSVLEALFFILLLNHAAFGTDASHPVSTGPGRILHVAKTGNDAGAGGEDAPFLTIGRAASEARPGDTVIIHAGTYREQVILPRG